MSITFLNWENDFSALNKIPTVKRSKVRKSLKLIQNKANAKPLWDKDNLFCRKVLAIK